MNYNSDILKQGTKMKISKKTLSILKNFAGINQSIVVKSGNVLQTISNVKDVFAKAEVEENFPQDFAIYDLNEFLGVVSLFEDPNFDFGESAVTISEGSSKQTYFYADPSVITQAPEKGVTLPSVEVEAKLTKEQLGTLIRAAAANGATDLTFADGDVKVHDKTVPNSNSYVIDGVSGSAGTYSLSISVEKLKMVSDDYSIAICSKGLSHFAGAQGVEYFVALQPDGSYSA